MTVEVNRLDARVRALERKVPLAFNFFTGGRLPGVSSKEVVFWEDKRLDVGKIAMRIGGRIYIFTSASFTIIGDGVPGDPPFSGLDHGGLTGLVPTVSDLQDDHSQYANLTPQTDARNVIIPAGTLDLGLRINGNFALGADPNANHSGTTGGGSVLNGMWFDSTFMEKSITGDDSSGNLRMSVNVAHTGSQSVGVDLFGPVQTTLDGVTWAIAPGAGGLVFYKGSTGGGDENPFPAFRFRATDSNFGSNAKYFGNFMFGKGDVGGEVQTNSTFPLVRTNGLFPRVEIHTAGGTDKANGLLIYSGVANTGARGTTAADPIPFIIEQNGTATEFLQFYRSTNGINRSLWITIPNVASPNSRCEFEYDGQTMEFNVSGMSAYPSSVVADSGAVVKQKLTFVDQDGTPVANRRFACVDGLLVATSDVDVEGKHFSGDSIFFASDFTSLDPLYVRRDGTTAGAESQTQTFDNGITLPDNAKILLGSSAGDGEIYWNTTTLRIDPGTGGDGFVSVGGPLRVVGGITAGFNASSEATFTFDAVGTATNKYVFLPPSGGGTLLYELTNTLYLLQSAVAFTFESATGNLTFSAAGGDITTTCSGDLNLGSDVDINLNCGGLINLQDNSLMLDNVKALYGTASDAEIFHNATDLVIHPGPSLNLRIGNNSQAGDPTLIFDGATNAGTFIWDDDADGFRFDDFIAVGAVPGTGNRQFQVIRNDSTASAIGLYFSVTTAGGTGTHRGFQGFCQTNTISTASVGLRGGQADAVWLSTGAVAVTEVVGLRGKGDLQGCGATSTGAVIEGVYGECDISDTDDFVIGSANALHAVMRLTSTAGFGNGVRINNVRGLYIQPIVSSNTEEVGTWHGIDIEDDPQIHCDRYYGIRIDSFGGTADVANWGINCDDDIQVSTGNYLILEGSGTAKGDTRLRYDGSGTMELDVNATTSLKVTANSVDVQGAFSANLTLIDDTDSPYDVLVTDYSIMCDCTNGAVTVNLPAAASFTNRIINIGKTDSSSNAVTIDPNGSELINNELDAVFNVQHTVLSPQSNATGWQIL